LVEFALVAPLFFLLLFGVLDFGRLFNTQITLQNALREAGRFAVTGQSLPGLSRVDSIIQKAQQASGMTLNPSDIQISSTSTNAGPGRAGGPGDTVTISLSYDLHLLTPIIGKFFPNGVYHFTVSTTFKNEPFSPSQTN
jgi:Flp pilus assembly protein TadG